MSTCQTSSLNEGRIGRSRQPELRAILVVGTAPTRIARIATPVFHGHRGPARQISRPSLQGFRQRLTDAKRVVRSEHSHPIPRSTKAGRAGPATHDGPAKRRDRVALRSTKAGPAGPATPVVLGCMAKPGFALNEGRPGWAGNSRSSSRRSLTWVSAAQRRPARLGRQLVRGRPGRLPGRPSLNEGRPGWAGNSSSQSDHTVVARFAQRRPARLGRQLAPRARWSVSCHASAQRRPARLGRKLRERWPPLVQKRSTAQRRPARLGRQLLSPFALVSPLRHRSTKAGSAGPATLPTGATPTTPTIDAQRRPARLGRQLVRSPRR